MTALGVPQSRTAFEVRRADGAIVLHVVGQLDKHLATDLAAEIASQPDGLPVVIDLSETTLARTPALRSLLDAVLSPHGDVARRAVVVCRRISARRIVRHAAGLVPVAVVATLDEALAGCRSVVPPIQVDAVVIPFAGDQAGDCCDVAVTPGLGTAITVIDAAGYGRPAARLVSRLRSGAYRDSLQRGEPAAVLAALDRVPSQDADLFATALCVAWDRGAGSVRMSNAGHIPPVLLHGGRTTVLGCQPSPPLGLADARSCSDHDVPDGAALVLCSDGLVERRRSSLQSGLAALESVMRRRSPAETSAASLLADMVLALGPLEDDVTVVVAHARAVGASGSPTWPPDSTPT